MRSQLQNMRTHFDWSLTPVVKVLLWMNGIVYLFLSLAEGRPFLLSSAGGGEAVDARTAITLLLGLVPMSVTRSFMIWQPFSYMFLHGSFLHLLLNMLGLWSFGPDLERTFGSNRFLRYYLLCGVGGAICAVALYPSSPVATVGASGAIFGLMLAFGMLFPNRLIYFYGILPIRAKYFVIGFGLLTSWYLVTGSGGNVSHIAHFGGMAFGLMWFLSSRGQGQFRSVWRAIQKRRMRRKLRLVSRSGRDDPDSMDQFGNHTVH